MRARSPAQECDNITCNHTCWQVVVCLLRSIQEWTHLARPPRKTWIPGPPVDKKHISAAQWRKVRQNIVKQRLIVHPKVAHVHLRPRRQLKLTHILFNHLRIKQSTQRSHSHHCTLRLLEAQVICSQWGQAGLMISQFHIPLFWATAQSCHKASAVHRTHCCAGLCHNCSLCPPSILTAIKKQHLILPAANE
jgi:hypothetical protein